MKDMKEFKEWLEKEYEFWMDKFNSTDAEWRNKVSTIYGRLSELDRIKEFLDKGE